MEYYLAIKKDETMPFAATWMDLQIILSEITQKDRHQMISLICGVQHTIQTNLSIKHRQQSKENRFVAAGGSGVGGESVVRGALLMEEGASLRLHGGSRSGRQTTGL